MVMFPGERAQHLRPDADTGIVLSRRITAIDRRQVGSAFGDLMHVRSQPEILIAYGGVSNHPPIHLSTKKAHDVFPAIIW